MLVFIFLLPNCCYTALANSPGQTSIHQLKWPFCIVVKGQWWRRLSFWFANQSQVCSFSFFSVLHCRCVPSVPFDPRSWRCRGCGWRYQTDGQQDEAERVCWLLLQHKQKESLERHQPWVLRHKVSATTTVTPEFLLPWYSMLSLLCFSGQDEQRCWESTDCAAAVVGRKLLARRCSTWETKGHKILSHLCERQLHRLPHRVWGGFSLVPRPEGTPVGPASVILASLSQITF